MLAAGVVLETGEQSERTALAQALLGKEKWHLGDAAAEREPTIACSCTGRYGTVRDCRICGTVQALYCRIREAELCSRSHAD